MSLLSDDLERDVSPCSETGKLAEVFWNYVFMDGELRLEKMRNTMAGDWISMGI